MTEVFTPNLSAMQARFQARPPAAQSCSLLGLAQTQPGGSSRGTARPYRPAPMLTCPYSHALCADARQLRRHQVPCRRALYSLHAPRQLLWTSGSSRFSPERTQGQRGQNTGQRRDVRRVFSSDHNSAARREILSNRLGENPFTVYVPTEGQMLGYPESTASASPLQVFPLDAQIVGCAGGEILAYLQVFLVGGPPDQMQGHQMLRVLQGRLFRSFWVSRHAEQPTRRFDGWQIQLHSVVFPAGAPQLRRGPHVH